MKNDESRPMLATFAGIDAEREACERINRQRRDKLAEAMRRCGIYPHCAAWRLAMLLFNLTKHNQRPVDWTNAKIAADSFMATPRGRQISADTVRHAARRLRRCGVIYQTNSIEPGRGISAAVRGIEWGSVFAIAEGKTEGYTDRTTEGYTDRTTEGDSDRTTEGDSDRTTEGDFSTDTYIPLTLKPLTLPPPPPVADSAAGAEEVFQVLKSSQLSRRECERLIAEHAPTIKQARDAVATYSANRDKLHRAAAIAWWFDHGEWPAEGVRFIDAAAQDARQAAKAAAAERDRLDSLAFRIRKRGREQGATPEQIQRVLEKHLPEKYLTGV